ncbi:MAG: CRISPR-associated helicase Cas3' [Bacteroidetes bacterium]|nr:CRISPR-associated helicase Cas3' [Bacteroidota bacterium]
MLAAKYLWGKTFDDNGKTIVKPLWTHFADTGLVVLELWKNHISQDRKEQIAKIFNANIENAGAIVALWTSLHDIGKATPSFQTKIIERKIVLEREFGLSFVQFSEIPHGYASFKIIKTWIDRRNLPTGTLEIAKIISIHHGKIPNFVDIDEYYDTGDCMWEALQCELIDYFVYNWSTLFGINFESIFPKINFNHNGFITLSGLTTLADWIASMADYFPKEENPSDFSKYLILAASSAEKAVSESGFDILASFSNKSFKELFPGLIASELQELTGNLTITQEPSLTIIEAPAGEGKTEAALYLAYKQLLLRPNNGLYFALPTMATTNAMIERLLAFLKLAHNVKASGKFINFRLIHGKALLQPKQIELFNAWNKIKNVDGTNPEDGIVVTAAWLTSNKRSLMAPYGLGTVDQALTGVLKVKHFFLRLYGLSGKTVIIDEVHAYDVYMQHLIHRMLQWLKALNCNVILLSATLPSAFRNAFFRSWQSNDECDNKLSNNYPLVCHTSRKGIEIIEGFKTRKKTRLELRYIDSDPNIIGTCAFEYAMQGAAVAVICNTVRRAQKIFKILVELNQQQDVHIVLFHASFIHKHKLEIEERVKAFFGKGRQSLVKVLLVATQVVEQSMDIDFDVMISDLAPVDLLLQRAGRIHRHDNIERPKACETPILYWATKDGKDAELPELDDIGTRLNQFDVYDAFILFKTYHILKISNTWSLPDDYRELIEMVYNEEDWEVQANKLLNLYPYSKGSIYKALELFKNKIHKARTEFEKHAIPAPNKWQSIWNGDVFLNESDEELSDNHLQAYTRLGLMSIEMNILYRDASGCLFFDENGEESIKSYANKRNDFSIKLMQNSIRISNIQIIRAIQEISPRIDLKDTISFSIPGRILVLDLQKNGVGSCGSIFYSKEYGLSMNEY